MRNLAYVAVILGGVSSFAPRAAHAQAPAACSPDCAPDQSCVDGVCVAAGQAVDPSAAAAPPAGYPPPTGYPPPPANGYPPPPANGYPPGTYPPGSYPPPGAYAPGNYPPPPSGPAWRRGFLAVPYLGMQSYAGDNATNAGVGFRLGALLGGRINEMFSLNGELVIDADNLKNAPSNETEVQVELDFSPLVHVPQDNFELVFGPKLGYFDLQDSAGGTTARIDGPVFGFNAGVFVGMGQTAAIGALLSFAWRFPHEFCLDTGGGENCSTDIGSPPAIKVFGFTGAVLF